MTDKDCHPDEEAVRRTAFFLWEQAGQPPGNELHYWHLALEQHARQVAFDHWLAEGGPEASQDEPAPDGPEPPDGKAPR